MKARTRSHRVPGRACGVALACIIGLACEASPTPVAPTASTPTSCENDGECVVAAGSACNPCGACPGEAEYAINGAALAEEQGKCSTAWMSKPDAPRPACSPCPSPPAGFVHRDAACKEGVCTLVAPPAAVLPAPAPAR